MLDINIYFAKPTLNRFFEYGVSYISQNKSTYGVVYNYSPFPLSTINTTSPWIIGSSFILIHATIIWLLKRQNLINESGSQNNNV